MLLFDFDGTIADSLSIALEIANEVGPVLGMEKMDETRMKKLKSLSLSEIMKETGLAWHQLPKAALLGRAAFKRNMHKVKPIAGMPQLLHKLKAQDIRMGILTSNTRSTVQAFLKTHEIEVFDFIDAPRNVMGKATAMRRILGREGFSAQNVTMIGDEVRDIEAAKACGLRSIAVGWGLNSVERLKEAQPEAMVVTVVELEEKIQKYLFL
ncbi:MAG: HAD family hydrolase [Bacteroidia bacterium]